MTPGARLPRVCVVVLNWNGWADTIECLDSLDRVRYADLEVLVVDNGSTDGSVARIRASRPGAQILETGANLGYAGGNNAGIKTALANGADFVILLNNDAVVDPEIVTELVRAAEEVPHAGVFGAKIFHFGDDQQVWYAGARWDDAALEFKILKHDPAGHGTAFPTDYACGCALMVRRSVIDAIGCLEPKFFLTYEETDFCYRARRAGFEVVYVPAARVWHKISASFGGQESPLVSYFMTRNYLLWTERNLSKRRARAARKHLLRRLKWTLVPALPRLAGEKAHPAGIRAAWREFRLELKRRWGDPAIRAMFWGVAHYYMRRFGPAPRFVYELARSSGAHP